MKKKPIQTMHIGVHLDYHYAYLGLEPKIDNRPATKEEFDQYREELRSKGFQYFPLCPKVTKEGKCACYLE